MLYVGLIGYKVILFWNQRTKKTTLEIENSKKAVVDLNSIGGIM